MSGKIISSHLDGLRTTLEATRELGAQVAHVADRVVETLRTGGTLFFCGNGGSAADAQHLAAEYVVRFARERGALPALALTVDTSILTAAGNDFGFDRVFARQVEALAESGDLLILHSTSGNSANLVAAARVARERGIGTVAFLARDGGALRGEVDDAVVVPTAVTAHAQELHLALGHAICEVVDRAFSPGGGGASGGGGSTGLDAAQVEHIEEARRREKVQTLVYRRLAADAEAQGRLADSERFNALHADEQHHLSRLTARLLENGLRPGGLRDVTAPAVDVASWEDAARELEVDEVAFYRELLDKDDWSPETRAVLEEILESEVHHARELGGKWMSARPRTGPPPTAEEER